MNVCSIIIAVIIAALVGSGLGTIMRIERRLTKRDMLSVFSRVPFFGILGFCIWTKEFLKDLIKTKRVRISYIRYIYRSFFRILPSMCEVYAEVIIRRNHIARKKQRKKKSNDYMQVQQSIRNVSEREYNIVLKNGGII
ncbi:hypothetical protein [uncultured Agathobaculum sp.]|uniref:hypothetical protein n=1 Tax=uncultured Agathobaculum sp. TaxID=2048140 RepID=UPI00296E75DD